MGNIFRSRAKPVKTPTLTIIQNTGVTGKSHPPELDDLHRILEEQCKLLDEIHSKLGNVTGPLDAGSESIYGDAADVRKYFLLAVPTQDFGTLNSLNENEQGPDLAHPLLRLANRPVVYGTEVLQSAGLRSVVCHCFLNDQLSYQHVKTQRETVCCHIGRSCISNAGTYEVELNWEGESELQSLKQHCRKNPSHDKFIPVHEFDKEHLPALYRHDLIIELVRCLSTLTVRLRVDKISLSRPSPPYPPIRRRDHLGRDCSINGTGHVTSAVVCSEQTDTACACPECLDSANPVRRFAKIFIQTAAHVVHDDLEAANTTCYFNYVNDIDGLDTAVKVQGTKGVQTDVKEDRCWMFGYTHDLSLAKKLGFMSDKYQRLRREVSDKYCVNWSDTPEDKLTIIVSHPHGCSKYVTIGNIQDRHAAPDDVDWSQYSYTTPTCPGSSGAPIFMLGKHGYIDNHHHSGAVYSTGLNVSTFGLF